MSDKSIYELDLHERVPELKDQTYINYHIHRVPGGWIYEFSDKAVFVPFHNEFQKVTEEDMDKYRDMPTRYYP